MSGDWIKMRNNLWDDPRVSRLCELTQQTEATVIGGLYWLWACADEHSEDGFMSGSSLSTVDRKSGIENFGKSLVEINWLAEESGGIRIIRFDEHNGVSAKRRSMEARRKGATRKVGAINADNSHNPSASHADKVRTRCGTREEKNIKYKPPIAPNGAGFDLFWAEYPKKKNKGTAIKAWKKLKPDKKKLDDIMSGLDRSKTSHDWTKENGQYIPHPATWLNAMGWQDEHTELPAAPGNGSGILYCEYQDSFGDSCGLPNAQPCKAYGKPLCSHHAEKFEHVAATHKNIPTSAREILAGLGHLRPPEQAEASE